MERLAKMSSIDHAHTLTETLDAYFERLTRVACVTIVNELMRSLAQFYDGALASASVAAFRSNCQSHPLHDLLLEDPFTARAFRRPCGQSVNAAMLDYIYRPRYLPLSAVGDAVHFVTTNIGAAESITARRNHLARLIAKTVRRTRRAQILAIESGHLRELDIVRGMIDRRDFHILALDPDCASLREAVNANPDFNITPLEQPASASHLSRDDDATRYDLIYSAGLFDHLPDAEASDLLARLVDKLKPDGRLIVGNYAPENYGRGYMEGMMGWSVIHRHELDLERLSDSSKLRRCRTYRDAPGNIVYLEVSSART
jgi:extracellular factor (EF) 3-hydroxypalmitic acid methyl ester biosynthesis protein